MKRGSLTVIIIAPLVLAVLVIAPLSSNRADTTRPFNPFRSAVPNVDINMLAAGLRTPTSTQLAALNQFKSTYGSQAAVRWNPFAGSPDVMMAFHTAPSTDTPENTARSFVSSNSALFGIDSSSLVLADQKEALGGYLLRFQQRAAGANVLNGGLGFVMTSDRQIRMVMGSTFRDVNVSPSASLSAATATTTAQAAFAQYAISRPAN